MAVIKEAPPDIITKLVEYGMLPYLSKYSKPLGADIDSRNHSGYTALHSACCIEYLPGVEALLDLGANPNLPNNAQFR